MAKIVETCNFDSDYPDEKFLVSEYIKFTNDAAAKVADELNHAANFNRTHHRFWKVVDDDYKLRSGSILD